MCCSGRAVQACGGLFVWAFLYGLFVWAFCVGFFVWAFLYGLFLYGLFLCRQIWDKTLIYHLYRGEFCRDGLHFGTFADLYIVN